MHTRRVLYLKWLLLLCCIKSVVAFGQDFETGIFLDGKIDGKPWTALSGRAYVREYNHKKMLLLQFTPHLLSSPLFGDDCSAVPLTHKDYFTLEVQLPAQLGLITQSPKLWAEGVRMYFTNNKIATEKGKINFPASGDSEIELITDEYVIGAIDMRYNVGGHHMNVWGTYIIKNCSAVGS